MYSIFNWQNFSTVFYIVLWFKNTHIEKRVFIFLGNFEGFYELIGNQNVDVAYNNGTTLLHKAAEYGIISLLNCICQFIRNLYEIILVSVGNMKITRFLIESGASVNKADKDGRTALDFASIFGK